jgi:hypothetical protein
MRRIVNLILHTMVAIVLISTPLRAACDGFFTLQCGACGAAYFGAGGTLNWHTAWFLGYDLRWTLPEY